MNALCFADISLPILQAFFKFIFIPRIICSLKLFDNSTPPHSSTRFIAGHLPIAYFNAFFNIWPHPAKSNFLNVSSRSSISLHDVCRITELQSFCQSRLSCQASRRTIMFYRKHPSELIHKPHRLIHLSHLHSPSQ